MNETEAPYTLGEVLGLLCPVVGCPRDEAADYIALVLGKDNDVYIGASNRLPPRVAAEVLRSLADGMEAGQ
jgi:hypothetical protein